MTVNDAVPLLPPLVPVTVCAPSEVAVHVVPEQEPSGPIENVVDPVMFPSELLNSSKPWAVYACDPVVGIDALAGESTMWSSGPTTTEVGAESALTGPPSTLVMVTRKTSVLFASPA